MVILFLIIFVGCDTNSKDMGNQIGSYINDKKEGTWIYYYANNNIAEIGSYNNGERIGPWSGWFRNGFQSYFGEYKNGNMHGDWSFYYKNGCLRSVGKFRENYKIGKWTMYHVDGDSTNIRENGTVQSFIPIDLEFPIPIESTKLMCEKKNVESLFNIDSIRNLILQEN